MKKATLRATASAFALLGAGFTTAAMVAAPAAAQDYTSAALSGTVQDEGGAPIAGATVQLVSLDLGFTRSATTTSNGGFRYAAVPPGNYDLVVSRDGAEVYRAEGLRLLASQNANVDVVIPGGGDSNEVIVIQGATLLNDFEGTTTGLNVDVEDLVKTVPIGRSLTDVMLLAPGTTRGDSAFGNLASVGGSSVAENAYYVNGLNITNFDNYLGSATVPFEMYRTVEVKSGGYPAEFGRATGGIVNAVTKSGTNDWTGALHLNWSPDWLRSDSKDIESCSYNDPTDPSEGVTCVNSTRRELDEANSLSTTLELGGPVIKDRLFVYGLLELNDDESLTISRTSGLAIEDKRTDPFWGFKVDAYPVDDHHLEFTMFDTRRTTRRNFYSYAEGDNGDANIGLAGSVLDINRGGVSFVGKYTGRLSDFLTISGAYGRMRDRFDNFGVAGDAALPVVRNVGGSLITYAPGTPGTSNFATDAAGNPILPFLSYTNGQASASTSFPYNTEREFYRADADLYFNAAGDHHVRIGFDQENNDLEEAAVRTGGTYLFENGLLSEEAYNAGYGNAGLYYQLINGSILQINYFNSSGVFGATNRAWYIQDEWSPTDRLTLSLGLRRDDFEIKKADGSDYVSQKENYAPRLGLTYDVFPDKGGTFKAFYGQYYLPFASNTAFRQVGSEIYIRERFLYDGFNGDGVPILTGQWTGSAAYQGACPINLTGLAISTGNHCNVTGDGSVADTSALIASNLKATKQSEWILGYEQNIGEWKAGINYTNRRLDRTAEDVAIDEAVIRYCEAQGITGCSSTWTGFHQYVIVNPGEDVIVALDGLDGREVTFKAEDLGYPAAVRKYDAVELTFNRPFDGVWSLGGSYVWSKSRGNSEGFVQSDFGQDDAGITQDFDQPGFTDGAYGPLPNDRRHRIKLWGAYKLFDALTLGANMSISSPRPLSCFGYDPRGSFLHPDEPYTAFGNAYGAASHFCGGELSPRGTALESDWITEVNMKAAYDIDLGGDRALTLRADVFNLFNAQGVQARNEVGDIDNGTTLTQNPDGSIANNPYVANPSFGLPQVYQAPRAVRLGLDLAF